MLLLPGMKMVMRSYKAGTAGGTAGFYTEPGKSMRGNDHCCTAEMRRYIG